MNELLWLLMLVVNFGAILVVYRLFGKIGLFIWVPIAAITANIQVLKTVEIFGLTATLGNIVYATSFLVTDILSEGDEVLAKCIDIDPAGRIRLSRKEALAEAAKGDEAASECRYRPFGPYRDDHPAAADFEPRLEARHHRPARHPYRHGKRANRFLPSRDQRL